MNYKLLLLITLIVLISVSCAQNRDPHFAMIPLAEAFLAGGRSYYKVDILWIIDNSGTMGPKQTNLKNSIAAFTNEFATRDIDFRLAVTTTDIRPIDPAAPNDPNLSGQAGCFVGTPTILTPSTANLATTLGNNANVGFFGSADAHGLDAISLALSDPNKSGCNSGFLRSDAHLAVIIFSDADDNTTATANAAKTFLDSLQKTYTVNAMVVEDLTRPECIALGPFSEKGRKFIELAAATNGTVQSICEADFSSGLLAISNRILEETTSVELKVKAELSSISVEVSGRSIRKDSGNGWTYDDGAKRIVFHGSAIPAQGSDIKISYTPSDVIR